MTELEKLSKEIVACRKCPRLEEWREEVARVKRTGVDITLVTVDDLLHHLDEFHVKAGVPAGLEGFEAAPLPQIDSRRRSAEELIKSQGVSP